MWWNRKCIKWTKEEEEEELPAEKVEEVEGRRMRKIWGNK